MGWYIGIDMGTSSVKSLLVGEGGAVLAQAERAIAIACPHPGWREVDPNLWWQAAKETVAELVGAVDAGRIRGIGVTGQMHSTVFVDDAGRSIRPALMWNDTRTAEVVEHIRPAYAAYGEPYLARLVSTGSPAANLAWLRDEEPEHFERLSTFLIGPDWLVFRLTGTMGTDFCEASTSSLFNLEARAWSQAARAALDLPQSIFPTVRGAAEIAGTLRSDVAAELGLHPDTIVAVGTGDNPAAAIPTGSLTANMPVLSLGTSGVLLFCRPKPDYAARGKNILFSLDGSVCSTLVQGVVQSCGSSLSWLANTVFGEDDYSFVDQIVPDDLPLPCDPLFYPHLTGEKTIYADPHVRGAFLGLGTESRRAVLTRSVLEGISFGFRQLMDEMAFDAGELDTIYAIGGGARSRRWLQLLADVLGLRVAALAGQASAGMGAALLAGVAAGDIAPEALGSVGVEVRQTYAPRAEHSAAYGARYERYLRIHDALAQVWD